MGRSAGICRIRVANLLTTVATHWGWIGLDPLEIVGRNAFGNLLIKDAAGAYWRICPEELSCLTVADNATAFEALCNDAEFQLDWEMALPVKAAREALGALTPGRVYYLIIPAVFNGAYDVKNYATAPVEEVIALAGHWALEIKDLPEGAQIELRVID